MLASQLMKEIARAAHLAVMAFALSASVRTAPNGGCCALLTTEIALWFAAGLLVLHAHAENPVEAFGRLYHSAQKPPLMKEGKMESRILTHHLLVHGDNIHAEGGYARFALRSPKSDI